MTNSYVFKNLLQIYALLICFVVSLVVLISFIVAVNSGVTYVFTETMIPQQLIDFESDDSYEDYLRMKYASSLEKKTVELPDPVNLGKKRLEEKVRVIKSAKNAALSGLINALQWFFISGVFFMIHWRLYRRWSE